MQERMEYIATHPKILRDESRVLLRQISEDPDAIDKLLDSLKIEYRAFNNALAEAASKLFHADDDPKERILPAILLFEDAKTIEERRKVILEGGLLLDEAEDIIDYWLDATKKNSELGGQSSMKTAEMLKYHRHEMALPLKSQYLINLQLKIEPIKTELFHLPGTVRDVVPSAVKLCRQVAEVILSFIDEILFQNKDLSLNISTKERLSLQDKLSLFIQRVGVLEPIPVNEMKNISNILIIMLLYSLS